MGKLERDFQSKLIKELETIFPGIVILKTDPEYLQGIPDLLLLWGRNWALLECKRSANASHQPNQDYYVDLFGRMSFSSFIYPENKEEVLYALQQSFRADW